MERAANRGGHSLYCSMVYIDGIGEIGSVHRKLMPTHEERLVWAIGDGHGLRTHKLGPFTLGGLNCWENWLPLARSALYAQGEDLHVAIWPAIYHTPICCVKSLTMSWPMAAHVSLRPPVSGYSSLKRTSSRCESRSSIIDWCSRKDTALMWPGIIHDPMSHA